MLHRIAIFTFAVFLITAVFLSSNLLNSTTEAATLPPDFEDVVVAAIGAPTALAFTPDGRLLITTQQGQVRVYQNGALLATPAVNLNSRLCTNSERGLLGVAVDPNFAANRYVYFYYTFKKTAACDATAVNRVARFVLADNNTIDTGTETVLIDNIHSPAGNHNGGDLHFGKDSLLYISVGDGGCDYANNSGCAGANDAARDRHVMLGKILRITRDGAIPASNPFQGAGTGRCNVTGSTTSGNWCQETFASGLRNPFRISFDSNAANTRFLSTMSDKVSGRKLTKDCSEPITAGTRVKVIARIIRRPTAARRLPDSPTPSMIINTPAIARRRACAAIRSPAARSCRTAFGRARMIILIFSANTFAAKFLN